MLPHVRRQTRPRVRIRRWPSALRGGGSRLGKELLGVGRRSTQRGTGALEGVQERLDTRQPRDQALTSFGASQPCARGGVGRKF